MEHAGLKSEYSKITVDCSTRAKRTTILPGTFAHPYKSKSYKILSAIYRLEGGNGEVEEMQRPHQRLASTTFMRTSTTGNLSSISSIADFHCLKGLTQKKESSFSKVHKGQHAHMATWQVKVRPDNLSRSLSTQAIL